MKMKEKKFENSYLMKKIACNYSENRVKINRKDK